MKIPDEAVQAAQATYMTFGIDDEMMREALTAAAPYMSGVKVKQLEWFPLDLPNTLYAHSAFGMYTVWEIDGVGFFRKEGGYGRTKVVGNIKAAKDAAQADYEARILSALEPSSARDQQGKGVPRYVWDAHFREFSTALAALSSQPVADGPERRKFYRKHWELSKLLEARNGGLVDHSGGEAWRYEYTSKDENGEYDMLYRHNVNSSVPAHLPASPGASVEGLSAEQERLRFEGDLDKWIKIIGSGITGYQPEAYALMDLACEELVKLRADNAAKDVRIGEQSE